MKTRAVRFIVPLLLIALFLLPAHVFAADDIEVIITVDDDMECRLTTFEGASNYAPINPDLGGLIPELNASFPGGWMLLSAQQPAPREH